MLARRESRHDEYTKVFDLYNTSIFQSRTINGDLLVIRHWLAIVLFRYAESVYRESRLSSDAFVQVTAAALEVDGGLGRQLWYSLAFVMR